MSYFVNKAKELPEQTVYPGIVGHLVHTDKVTIADFRIKAGTELPLHQHPHEQTSTILAGKFKFNVGGEVKMCGPGDVAIIPPNVEHSAIAITDCRIIDVFNPVREDYKIAGERLAAPQQNHTTYQPVDCGIYDHFEAAIVQRRKVLLVYLDDDDLHVAERTRLIDLKAQDKEEFVQLPNQEWLRLDRVISVDGVRAGASCKGQK